MVGAQIETRVTEIIFTNGCKIEWPRRFHESKPVDDKAQFTWAGACLNNLAQGQGTLSAVTDSGRGNRVTTETKATLHEGRHFGYRLQSTRIEPSPNYATSGPIWLFKGNSGEVYFSAEGAGLKLEGDPFGSLTPLPIPAPILTEDWGLGSRSRSAVFVVQTCRIAPRVWPILSELCVNKPNEHPLYFIVSYEAVGDADYDAKSAKVAPCPNPHSPVGCGELIERIVAPIRDEILAYIGQNRPANDALLARMNAAPQQDLERRAARQQKEAEENRAFQDGLQRMNPGQLYALSDKLLAQGDQGKAREVLRTLIARFPDHALSATASQQLAGLSAQPSSAAKPTVLAAVPAAAECRATLGFLTPRLPNFPATELNSMRSAIVGQSVVSAISGAKAQGYSQENAIKAVLAQAKEFDRVSRESAQCAADVDAMGASDDDFLAAMRQGRAPSNCGGIRNACLCAGIVNRISAVAARALAAEMQCFARSGKW